MDALRELATTKRELLAIARWAWQGRCSHARALEQAAARTTAEDFATATCDERQQLVRAISAWSPWRGHLLAELACHAAARHAERPAIAACTALLAETKIAWGDWSGAKDLCDALASQWEVERATEAGRLLLGRVYLTQAQAEHGLNNLAEAERELHQAHNLLLDGADAAALADCDLLEAAIERTRGNYATAAKLASAAEMRFRQAGSLPSAALAQAERAYIAVCEQRYADAEILLAVAQATFQAAGQHTRSPGAAGSPR